MTTTHGGNLFSICRERGWDWHDVLDLSASINPLGPPPGVRSAVEQALDRIAHYPGERASELENVLAGAWDLDPGSLIAGSGATELLHFFARAGWQGPTAVVTPAWSQFYRAFPHALRVPADDPGRWPQRGLLVLSQPVNPTGEELPPAVVRHAIAAREGPVLIDESFIEFTELESAAGWCANQPNLIVLRSLSKFYALPGLRVGALAASPEWIAKLQKRREPWAVGALAEAAAVAALADRDYGARTRELITEERRWLIEQLSELAGLRVTPGQANFLFAETEQPARQICDFFLERKIILRNCTGLPGIAGEAIRFAVRTRPENERFVAAARELFAYIPPSIEPAEELPLEPQ